MFYVFVGLVASIFVAEKCNILALEEKTVRSLDINITIARIVISMIAVFIASITTAVVGTVSFIGLIVPHMGRLLVGTNHRILIPYSGVLGAFLFLLADTLGRTIAAPYEISASIIMSIVGGPFLIVLLLRNGGWNGR